MLADSYIVPECIVKPGSFGALMALYEGNFIKLNELIPNLNQRSGLFLSCNDRDCNLRLTVEETTKYTCVLRLTYLFPQDLAVLAEPDLCLKVYFDARMVEVRSWARQHRHDPLYSLSNRFGRELNRRWPRNIMLSKWLDYLLDMGHSFPPRLQPSN